MTDMDSKQSIPSGFLSFSLVAQEIISVLFAFYSYQSGEMALATFYLGVAGILLVGLGIHSIFDRPALVRGLLAAVLIVTFFYLLSTVPDSSVLLWCLTIIPVLVGTFGSRVSMIILASIFAATLWLFFGNSGFISPDVYSEVVIARFLSAFAVLSLFAIAMDNSHSRSLHRYKDLSLRVDQIAHQDQLTQLPNRLDMERRLEKKYQQYRLINQPFSILLADLDRKSVV